MAEKGETVATNSPNQQGAPDAEAIAKQRGTWDSRLAFYFVAVGSAVGFGNVWRFPALAVSYGGGAFFIPYLLALFLIGLPLLMLEVGFGQFFQTGDVNVFGGFNERFRGVGVASIACGYMLVCYYSMLIAWVINAFFDSFSDNSPWDDPDLNGTMATDYFFNEIVGQKTLGEDQQGNEVVGKNVGYSLLAWFIMWLCVAFGVKWTGRVTYFTMGLPIILMFIFLGKGLSLDGSEDGVEAYIGEWDVSILREDGEVWSKAVSQIFFSLSVTFGIMTAYGSYCPPGEPAFLNSAVVALANSCFSIISGFAVFGALGHLAYKEGVDVKDLNYGGFSLVFGTWPVVLRQLSGGIHWVRLLFFDLFLLGIDSAFSFIEGFTTVARDTRSFQHTPKWKLSGALCLVGWLLSLLYATDAGFIWLDVVDFYINFTMLIVGFFETFAAGWVYGADKQIEKLGLAPVLTYMVANFGSVVLACGIWFGVSKDDGGVWGGFLALIAFYLAGLAATAVLLKKRMEEDPDKWTWSSILWEISFKNVVDLSERIKPIVGYYPMVWNILVKQFIPHVLLILFVNLAQSDNGSGESVLGHYSEYPTKPYQVLGVLTFVFAASLFLAGLIEPRIYYPFRLPEGHFALDPEGERAMENLNQEPAEDTMKHDDEVLEEDLEMEENDLEEDLKIEKNDLEEDPEIEKDMADEMEA